MDKELELFMRFNTDLQKSFIEISNEILKVTMPYEFVGIDCPSEVKNYIEGIKYSRKVFSLHLAEYQELYFELKNKDKS